MYKCRNNNFVMNHVVTHVVNHVMTHDESWHGMSSLAVGTGAPPTCEWL